MTSVVFGLRGGEGIGLNDFLFRFRRGSAVPCNAVIADFLVLQNYPRNANISISRDPEQQTTAPSDPQLSCSLSRPLVHFLLKIIY